MRTGKTRGKEGEIEENFEEAPVEKRRGKTRTLRRGKKGLKKQQKPIPLRGRELSFC